MLPVDLNDKTRFLFYVHTYLKKNSCLIIRRLVCNSHGCLSSSFFRNTIYLRYCRRVFTVCSVSWRLLTIDTRTPSPKLNSTWHSCLTWNCAVPHTVPVLFCFICNFSFAFQFHDSTSSHDFVWLTVILHNQPDCDALRYFSHFHLFEITRELSVCRF